MRDDDDDDDSNHSNNNNNDNIGNRLLRFSALFLYIWCKLNSLRLGLTFYVCGGGMMK